MNIPTSHSGANASERDWIHLRDLEVECILGVYPAERQRPRTVRFNLSLACDTRSASVNDRLDDTLNYERIEEEVRSAAIKGRYRLIETLAETAADICLAYSQVSCVRVVVDKPGALRNTRSVAVEITRHKN